MILTDASNKQIIKAIENNTYEYRKWFSKKIEHKEIIQNKEFYLFCSGYSFGFANFIIDINIDYDAEKKIAGLLSIFKEKQLPFLCIIGNNSKPNNIREILISNDVKLHIKEPGMAMNLSEITESINPIENFRTIRVTTQEEMKIWNDIRKRVYDFPRDIPLDSFLLPVLDENVSAFLGYVEGEPVATSLIFYSSGVAGLYSVTTLPEYRKKGLGTYLTLLALIDAKRRGYKIATLHSSEKGLHVYEKIGFKQYSEIEYYFWKKRD